MEIIWTFKSFYKLSVEEIQYKVSSLLALENLQIKNRELLFQALDYFVEKKIDFADAYNFLLAQKENKKIISFDEDFDKLGERENLEKLIK